MKENKLTKQKKQNFELAEKDLKNLDDLSYKFVKIDKISYFVEKVEAKISQEKKKECFKTTTLPILPIKKTFYYDLNKQKKVLFILNHRKEKWDYADHTDLHRNNYLKKLGFNSFIENNLLVFLQKELRKREILKGFSNWNFINEIYDVSSFILWKNLEKKVELVFNVSLRVGYKKKKLLLEEEKKEIESLLKSIKNLNEEITNEEYFPTFISEIKLNELSLIKQPIVKFESYIYPHKFKQNFYFRILINEGYNFFDYESLLKKISFRSYLRELTFKLVNKICDDIFSSYNYIVELENIIEKVELNESSLQQSNIQDKQGNKWSNKCYLSFSLVNYFKIFIKEKISKKNIEILEKRFEKNQSKLLGVNPYNLSTDLKTAGEEFEFISRCINNEILVEEGEKNGGENKKLVQSLFDDLHSNVQKTTSTIITSPSMLNQATPSFFIIVIVGIILLILGNFINLFLF